MLVPPENPGSIPAPTWLLRSSTVFWPPRTSDIFKKHRHTSRQKTNTHNPSPRKVRCFCFFKFHYPFFPCLVLNYTVFASNPNDQISVDFMYLTFVNTSLFLKAAKKTHRWKTEDSPKRASTSEFRVLQLLKHWPLLVVHEAQLANHPKLPEVW